MIVNTYLGGGRCYFVVESRTSNKVIRTIKQGIDLSSVGTLKTGVTAELGDFVSEQESLLNARLEAGRRVYDLLSFCPSFYFTSRDYDGYFVDPTRGRT